jgi:flagellar biosynthetic protein FliP
MMRRRPWLLPLLLIASCAIPCVVWAANGLPAFNSTPGPGGSTTYSFSVQTLILITALTFLPALLMMMTAFMRIVIVLSLLRQALGTVQTPPNQILIGMSLFLTFFVMAPTLDKINEVAYQPLVADKITFNDALVRGSEPLKQFMLKQTRQQDLALFVKLSNHAPLAGPEAVPMTILVPAFVTSELKTAFQIGFVIFIPFLIIDMVVASVLQSIGMVMLSPVLISLPFKLMMFVLVDGWNLLLASLVRSFGV